MSIGAGSSELSDVEGSQGNPDKEEKDIGWLVAKNFIEIFSGLFYGFLVAALFSLTNYIPIPDKILVWIKMLMMFSMAIVTPILAYVTQFPEGKYIGIIFFGYGCNCLWKTKK